MELSPYDKSRCRFHLGMSSGSMVPAGDLAALEEAMARIPDGYWYGQVIYHLDRCDRTWRLSEIFRDETQPMPSRIERITGDTERAIFQSDPLRADREYREIYLREVDRLAETLYVPNYRREDARSYAIPRGGAEYILAVPGPADTSVGTRVATLIGTINWR
jgi:hypothetical protein